MSGWIEPITGLPRPDGPDYVADIPAIERDFMRRLVPLLRNRFETLDDVRAAYPQLTTADAGVSALVPSDGVEYRWDGKQWGPWDLTLKSWTPIWATGSELGRLAIMDGTLEGVYMRRGPLVWWKITLIRGERTNLGTGAYSWTLPFAMRSYRQTGTGYVRASNVESSGGVAFRDSTRAILVVGGRRVGSDSFAWTAGDEIVLSGETLMGGVL